VEFDKQITNRVKRMEGQLRGILKMMEENKECKDVITQLSAVRSAADKTMGLIVSANLVDCMLEGDKRTDEPDALIKEAVNLLVKSR
jgi:DNA-binding FrmR family transcriptional regulator